MNNALLQTEDSSAFITKALDDFLRDKTLTLTPQQYAKLKKLLMVRLLDEELSYENAYSHLCEIREHRKDYEINANAPDEAEEEMIRIIGAADVQEKQVTVEIETDKYKKRFYIALALLALVCCGLAASSFNRYLDGQKMKALTMAQVINSDEENIIKDLVQQVVTLETQKGNDITHSAIYAEMKNIDGVIAHGEARSYKKFNRAQYEAAVAYLQGRVGEKK